MGILEAGDFLITLRAYQLVLVWLQVSKEAVYKRFRRGGIVNGRGRKFSVTGFPRACCHWVLFCDKIITTVFSGWSCKSKQPLSLEGNLEQKKNSKTCQKFKGWVSFQLLLVLLYNIVWRMSVSGVKNLASWNFITFISQHFMFQIKCAKNAFLLIWLDSQVGVLRIWNVSRTTPVDNFKLKKTGFHCLHVLNSPPRKKCK